MPGTANKEKVIIKQRFTGICTFVERPDKKGYKVFMVDGRNVRNPGTKSTRSHLLKGPVHLAPLVLFDRDRLERPEICPRRPDLVIDPAVVDGLSGGRILST